MGRTDWKKYTLCHPVVDKTAAIFCCLYSLHLMSVAYGEKQGFALLIALFNGCLHSVLVLIRHTPRRITMHPLHWAIALLGAYWHLAYALFIPTTSVTLAPMFLIKTMALVGLVLFVWGRVSLGRSFGIVASERKVITKGAYRFMRHPIYGSSLLTSSAYLLERFCFEVLGIWFIGGAIILLKSHIEERFLKQSLAYRDYALRVRARFIPGIL